MVHAGLVVLLVLAGCRIGFDPIAGAETDAGALGLSRDGCIAGIPCAVIAHPGDLVSVVCSPGLDCSVECGLAALCAVDCNGASSCLVSCPAVGCSVSRCDARCDVGCGQTALPTHAGATATCP